MKPSRRILREDRLSSTSLLLQSRRRFIVIITVTSITLLLLSLVFLDNINTPGASFHNLNSRVRQIIRNKLCCDNLFSSHCEDGVYKNTPPARKHISQRKVVVAAGESSPHHQQQHRLRDKAEKMVVWLEEKIELEDKIMELVNRSVLQWTRLIKNPYPPAKIGNYTCQNSFCSEFLSPRDHYLFRSCSTRRNMTAVESVQVGKCHFMDGRHRSPVALASFPGSGNTWVRGLLEQATGICTGSIYCDKVIRANGMNGESIRSGVVLVTKIHTKGVPKELWTKVDRMKQKKTTVNNVNISGKMVPVYGAVVLLIRNPFRALIAEYSRQKSPIGSSQRHTAELTPSQFMNSDVWSKFVSGMLQNWWLTIHNWITDAAKRNLPLLVVRYEDVKMDNVSEVKRMLNFLNVTYNEDELKQRLAEDFGKFHRKHGEEFEHFTPQQSSLVRDTIRKTIDFLKKHNHGDTLKLEEYLQSTVT